jgi:hypothetical protein
MQEIDVFSEMPRDISGYLTDFITTRALLNMTQVSKGFNGVFHHDNIWHGKLSKLGFSNEEIKQLKEACKAPSYSALYKTLNSKVTALDNTLARPDQEEEKSLQRIAISSDVIKLIGQNMVSSISGPYERFMIFFDPLREGCLFNSLVDYNAHQFCPTICKPKYWKRGKLEDETPLLEILPTDSLIGNVLAFVNLDECVPKAQSDLLLENCDFRWGITKRSPYSQLMSIIPIDLESFYFISEAAHVKTKTVNNEFLKCNFKERFILKISEVGYELLDYTVSADGLLTSHLEKAFSKENVERKFNAASNLQPFVWSNLVNKSPSL